jgi:hypothetical protein
LRIPERIHGEVRDDFSYFVHEDDEPAHAVGPGTELFLARQIEPIMQKDLYFAKATGALFDRFSDGLENYTFLVRPLPIVCEACVSTFWSYRELVTHCKQWSHRQNMDEMKGRRVPYRFVDPRNKPDYISFSSYKKVVALKLFEYRFVNFLHEPDDEAGRDNLTHRRQQMTSRLGGHSITPEKFKKACIECVLYDFYNNGIDRDSLGVVLHGWQCFCFKSLKYQQILRDGYM